MKIFIICILIMFFMVFPTMVAGQGIVVDHTSIPLFDQIPEQYLESARNFRILFMDRSVGVFTHAALDCLTAVPYQSSLPSCRRDYQFINGSWQIILRNDDDMAAGQVPAYIRYNPDATLYDRSGWDFFWFANTWEIMANDFILGLHNRSIPALIHTTMEETFIDPLDYDLISFQFSYLNVEAGSTIGNFFSNLAGEFNDIYDLEREVNEVLGNASPPRKFIYWTASLARSIGTDEAADFNNRMRQWCQANNKILFDFADIESHDMTGNPCYDNRDGIPYTTPDGNSSENYPDDGQNIPAICQEKTTETDGGHLVTAQGQIGVAKGFWVLAARIGGWNPNPTIISPPTNLRILD